MVCASARFLYTDDYGPNIRRMFDTDPMKLHAGVFVLYSSTQTGDSTVKQERRTGRDTAPLLAA
jgi:hypothetical protein